jgi:hypothetical protein
MTGIDSPYDFTQVLDQGEVRIAVDENGSRRRLFGDDLLADWRWEAKDKKPTAPKTPAKTKTTA